MGAMFDALKNCPRYFEDDDWPKNKRGQPKLLVLPAEADRLIASGAATEDDLIRMDPVPSYVGTWEGVRFIEEEKP